MITFYKNNNGLFPTENRENNKWINVVCPTQEETKFLLQELQIPEAFYNDIEDIDERPRIEIENGWFLIILRIPFKSNDAKLPFNTAPLGLMFKDDVFVSLSFHQTEILPDFVLYTQRKKSDISNHFDLVLKLLLSSSIWFLKYLKQINQRIRLAEDNLEKSIKNEELQALLQIEKCLVFFITSLKGNDMLFHRIKNLKNHRDDFDPVLVEDVEIELRQAEETTNIYSNILTGMMDAYASVISNNLNVIMKRLTSISIILMIPTLVASLYGMNVPNNLQENNHGFFIILLISLLISICGVFLFKKKNMF
ncbi:MULTISPECIES: magnesium transporter CorA family protein [unclassified Flavobacterium]|uniref:magnesium transporter CorA family protein n=1 Tax=unclassified Flavobacterium TaxID=196869 RepID=UPI00057CE3C4|nr:MULTISPECIES: magnesium transporter CorA family protein [unclassified Flavobacterium]KIC03861.1 magnesium transporter CorA [Flavobacterium sp. JRM]MEA9413777.1 magnesium transporter CorA family protein [Flavobacterium sp. PL02]OUL64102.1 magnesium transporter CorA [Flavobacterium sp. AJR]